MQDPVNRYNSIFGGVQADTPSGLNPVQSYEQAFGTDTVQPYINLDYRPRYDKYASIDVNLDYWRAENQSVGRKVINAVPRLVGQTIGKTIEDVGLLAGLMGIGNNSEERGGWIAGAADNWLAEYGASLDEASKELFPIFKMPGYDETNTFRKMSTASFWTDEVTDGLAFMLSALIPGTAIAKAGKVAKLSKLFGSAETLEALSKGAKGATSASKIDKMQNMATIWATQTAGEAMFEAKDSRDQTIANLTGKINPDTGMPYTQEEIVNISAQNAADTFQGNLMALALSNALEVKWLFGGSKAGKGLFGIKEGGVLGSEITTKELKGFQKFMDGYTGRVLKGVGKGAAAEGLWEENIQYSIQQLNDASLDLHRDDNSVKKFLKGIPGLLDLGDDKRLEAVMLGSILGVGGGVISEVRQKRRNDKDFVAGKKHLDSMDKRISSLDIFEKNPDIEVELTTDGKEGFFLKKSGQETPITKEEFDAFKKEHQSTKWTEDGGFKLEDGKKKVNPAKLNAFITQVDYFGKLMTALEYEKSKTVKDKNKIDLLRNDVLTEWIVSHLKMGAYDELVKRIDLLANADADSLSIWAADPDINPKDEVSKIKRKAESLKSIYEYTQENVFSDNPALKSELIRIASRVDLLKTQRGNMESRKAGLGSTPLEYNYQIEDINKEIDRYNALSRQLEAKSLKRGANVRDIEQQISESEANVLKLKREYAESTGIAVNEDLSKITDLKGPFAKMADQINALIADYDVSIDDLNKEWDLYAGKDGDKHFSNRVQGAAETRLKFSDKTTKNQFNKSIDNIAKIRTTEFNIDSIEEQYYDKAVNDQLDEEGVLSTIRRVLREGKPIIQLTKDRLSGAMSDALKAKLDHRFDLEVMNSPYYAKETLAEYQSSLADMAGVDIETVQEDNANDGITEELYDKFLETFTAQQLFKGTNDTIGYIDALKEIATLEGMPSSDEIKRMIIEEYFDNSNSIAEAFVASPEDYTSYQVVDSEIKMLTKLAELNSYDIVGNTTMTRIDEINELLGIEFKKEGLVTEFGKRLQMLDAISKIAKENAENRSKANRQYGESFLDRVMDAFGINMPDSDIWTEIAPILDQFEGDGFSIAKYEALIFNLKKSDTNVKALLEKRLADLKSELSGTFNYKGRDIIIDLENGFSVPYDRFIQNPKAYLVSILTSYYMKEYPELKKKGSPVKEWMINDNLDKFIEEVSKLPDSEMKTGLHKGLLAYSKIVTVRDVLYDLNSNYNPNSVLPKFAEHVKDNIPVTIQQEIAYNKMLHFLNSQSANPYSCMAIIKGLAGTGKTSVFFKSIMKVTGIPIQVAAPNPVSSLVIAKVAGRETSITTDDLLNDKVELIKSGLLVIDEINTYNPEALEKLIKKITEHSKQNPGFKVLFMGDPLQFSAVARTGQSFFLLDRQAPGTQSNNGVISSTSQEIVDLLNGIERLPSLGIVYRSYVGPLNEFVDKFKGETSNVSTVTAKCSTDVLAAFKEHPLGVYGVKDFDSWLKTTIHAIQQSSSLDKDPRKRLIISNFGRVKEIENALREAKLTIPVMEYAVAMGQTVNEAYVYIEKEQGVNTEDYNSILYTMFSRPTDFLLAGAIDVNQSPPDINMSTDALQESRSNDIKERREELLQGIKEQQKMLVKDKSGSNAKGTPDPDPDPKKPDDDDTHDAAGKKRKPIVDSEKSISVGHPTSAQMSESFEGNEVRFIRTMDKVGPWISVMVNVRDNKWIRVGTLNMEQKKIYADKPAEYLELFGEDYTGNLEKYTLDTGTYSDESSKILFDHEGIANDVTGKEALVRKYIDLLPGDVLKEPEDIDRMVNSSRFMFMQKRMRNEAKYGRDASDLNFGHIYLQINGIRYVGSKTDSKPMYYWLIPSKVSDPSLFQHTNKLADLFEEFDSLTGLSYDNRTEEYIELLRKLGDAPSVSSFKESQNKGEYKLLEKVEKISGKKYSDEELEQIHTVALQIDPLIWKKEVVERDGESVLRRTLNGLASMDIEKLALSNIATTELVIRRPIDRKAKKQEGEEWQDSNTKWIPLPLTGIKSVLADDFLEDPAKALTEKRHKRFVKILEYQLQKNNDEETAAQLAIDQYVSSLGKWTIAALRSLSSFDANGDSNQNNGFGLRREISNEVIAALNSGQMTDGNGKPYLQEDLVAIQPTTLVIDMKREVSESPVEQTTEPVQTEQVVEDATEDEEQFPDPVTPDEEVSEDTDDGAKYSRVTPKYSADLNYFMRDGVDILDGVKYYNFARKQILSLMNDLMDGIHMGTDDDGNLKFERNTPNQLKVTTPKTLREVRSLLPSAIKHYYGTLVDEAGNLKDSNNIIQYRAYKALMRKNKEGHYYVIDSILTSVMPRMEINEIGELADTNVLHIHDLESNQKNFETALFANTKIRLGRIPYISGARKGQFIPVRQVTAILLHAFDGKSDITQAIAKLKDGSVEKQSIRAFLDYIKNTTQSKDKIVFKQELNKANETYFKKEDSDLRAALVDNNVFILGEKKIVRQSTESTKQFLTRISRETGENLYWVENLYLDGVLWNTKNELETQFSLKKANVYASEFIQESYMEYNTETGTDVKKKRWVNVYRKRHSRGSTTTITDHLVSLVKESFDKDGLFKGITGEKDPNLKSVFIKELSLRKEAEDYMMKDKVWNIVSAYRDYHKSGKVDLDKAIDAVNSSIKSVAESIASFDNRFSSGSYISFRNDGKARYAYSMSSFGYDRLKMLENNTGVFKFNNVLEVVEYDANKNNKTGRIREFNEEQFDQVIARQFFDQVINSDKGFKSYYFQDAMVISSTKRLYQAKMRLLDKTAIGNAIKEIVKYESTRPDLDIDTYVKNKNRSYLPGIDHYEDGKAFDEEGNEITDVVTAVLDANEQRFEKGFTKWTESRRMKDKSGNNIDFKAGVRFDENYEAYAKHYGLDQSLTGIDAVKALMRVWHSNVMVNSYLLDNHTVGDYAFYGDSMKVAKRAKIVFTEGYTRKVKGTSRMAIVQDIERTIDRNTFTNLANTYEFLEGKKFTATDSFAFALPEQMEEEAERLGYGTRIHMVLKPIISGYRDVISKVDGRVHSVPFGVKCAVFSLTDDLVKDSQYLTDLREKMRKGTLVPGTEKTEPIGFIVPSSAIKYGAPVTKTAHNKEAGNEMYEDFLEDSIIDFNKDSFRMIFNPEDEVDKTNKINAQFIQSMNELNTPGTREIAKKVHAVLAKLYKKSRINVNRQTRSYSRLRKEIYDRLSGSSNREGVEEFFGYSMPENLLSLYSRLNNGQDVHDQVDTILSNPLARQWLKMDTQKFVDKYSENEANNVKVITDTEAAIIELGVTQKWIEDLKKKILLESGFDLNFPFIVDQAVSSLRSIYAKGTTEFKMPGSTLVLFPQPGWKNPSTVKIDDKGNTIPGTGNNLRPRDEDNCVEILVPGKPGDSVYNIGDIIFSYRMPTSGLHMGIPCKVVGYTNTYDNKVVIPAEFVLLHGIDFDVDELYVMRKIDVELKFKDIHDEFVAQDKEKTFEDFLTNYPDSDKAYQALMAVLKNTMVDEFTTLLRLDEIQPDMNLPFLTERFKRNPDDGDGGDRTVIEIMDVTPEKMDATDAFGRAMISVTANSAKTTVGKAVRTKAGGDYLAGTQEQEPKVNLMYDKHYVDITIIDGKKEDGSNKEQKYNTITRQEKDVNGAVYYTAPNGTKILAKTPQTKDAYVQTVIDNENDGIATALGITTDNVHIFIAAADIGMKLEYVAKIFKTKVAQTILRSKGVENGIGAAMKDVNIGMKTPTIDINNIDNASVVGLLSMLNKLGNDIYTAGQIGSLIREFPDDYAGIDKMIKEVEKMYDGKVEYGKTHLLTLNKNFSVQTDILKEYEGLRQALENILLWKLRNDKTIFRYHPEITKMAKDIRVHISAMLGGSDKGQSFKGNANDILEDVRKALVSYITSTVGFSFNGRAISLDVSKEEPYNNNGEMLYGVDAWNERFAVRLRQMQLANQGNIFLSNISVNKEWGFSVVKCHNAHNLEYGTIIGMKASFANLTKEEQALIMKYVVLNNAMKVGGTNITVGMPEDIWMDYNRALKVVMNDLRAEGGADKLKPIMDDIALKMIYNYADDVSYFKDYENFEKVGGKYTKGSAVVNNNKIFFDRKIKIKIEEDPDIQTPIQTVIVQFGDLYYLVYKDTTEGFAYYQHIAKAPRTQAIVGSKVILDNGYDITKVIHSDVRTFPVKEFKTEVEYKKEFEGEITVGDKIYQRLYSDVSRTSMREYKVTGTRIDGKKTFLTLDSEKAVEFINQPLKMEENVPDEIETLIGTIKERFNLDVNVINDSSLSWNGKIIGGTITINLAHAGPSTLWHEVFHPLIEVVAKENNELYQEFRKKVLSEKTTLASIKADPVYKKMDAEDQIKEAMVTIMERYSMKSDKSSISGLVQRMLAVIAKAIEKVLDISGIRKNTTLKDLVDAIVLSEAKIDLSEALTPESTETTTEPKTFFSRPINSNVEAIMAEQGSIEVIEEDGNRSYKKGTTTFDSMTEKISEWFTGMKGSKEWIEDRARKDFIKVGLDPDVSSIPYKDTSLKFADYINAIQDDTLNRSKRGTLLHKAAERIFGTKGSFDKITQEYYEKLSDFDGKSYQIEWVFKKAKSMMNAIMANADHQEMVNGELVMMPSTALLDEKDELFSEVKYTDDMFGIGTAADLIVKRSNGALGSFDYKFGVGFNKEYKERKIKYSDGMINDYWETPKNIAKLQLMFRTFIWKKNNPEARWSDLALLWIPEDGPIQRTEVPVEDMLMIIENFVKDKYASEYEELKSRGLFDFSNYLTRDRRVNDTLKGMAVEDAVELLEAELTSMTRHYEWLKSVKTLSSQDKENYEVRIRGIKEKLDDLIMIPAATTSSDTDISWFRKYFVSLGEIGNTSIQNLQLYFSGARQKANKEQKEIIDRFEKLLDDLFVEKGYSKHKRKLSEWTGVNVLDFWAFLYDEVADGSMKMKHWSSIHNPAERAIAKEMQETMQTYFDTEMNKDAWDHNGHLKKQYELLNQGERFKSLPPGFIPKVPVSLMELSQQYPGGMLNPKHMKAVLTNYVTDFHESYNDHYLDAETGELKSGLPGTIMPLRFMGNALVATTRNHSMNAAIYYPEFMKMLINKKHMEGVAAYGTAVKLQLEAKNFYKAATFMDQQVKHLVLGQKKEFKITRKDWTVTGKDGKQYIVDQRKVLLSLKHFITASTLWFAPVKGAFNLVMNGLNMAKMATAGSIAKALGMDKEDLLFTASDLMLAHKDYSVYNKDWLLGDQDNNKLNNISKVLQYKTDNYDLPIQPTAASIGSSKMFDNSIPFIFQRIGEDYGNLVVLAALLHHQKLPDGKSYWDAFDDQGNWVDTQERNIKVSETVSKPVVGLTDLEIINLKRASQRIFGSYRKDEAALIEISVLGEYAMQFKKYMPAILMNMYGGKYKDMSLGRFVKTEDVYSGKVTYEWVTRENQGVVITLIQLAYISRLFTNGKATRENWEKLSSLQKLQLSELAVTAFMVLGWSLAKMGIDDDDKEKNLYIRTNRLLGEDISQGLMPMDVLRNLKSQTIVFPKMVLIFDAFGKFMWDGVIQGERQRDGRIPGSLKLEQVFMPLIPVYGMQPELNKYLNSSSNKDEIGFLSLYDDMQKVR